MKYWYETLIDSAVRIPNFDMMLVDGDALRRLKIENDELRRKTFAPSSTEIALVLAIADLALEQDVSYDDTYLLTLDSERADGGDDSEKAGRRLRDRITDTPHRLHLACEALRRLRTEQGNP